MVAIYEIEVSDVLDHVSSRLYSLYIMCGIPRPLYQGAETVIKMARSQLYSAMMTRDPMLPEYLAKIYPQLTSLLNKFYKYCIEAGIVSESEAREELDVLYSYIKTLLPEKKKARKEAGASERSGEGETGGPGEEAAE